MYRYHYDVCVFIFFFRLYTTFLPDVLHFKRSAFAEIVLNPVTLLRRGSFFEFRCSFSND